MDSTITDDAVLKLYGLRMKQARIAKRMSAGVLSYKVGISVYRLKRIESGNYDLSLITVYAISAALDRPLDQFFE